MGRGRVRGGRRSCGAFVAQPIVRAGCFHTPFMSFEALAPHYRWLEFCLAGEKLQRCRTAFLEQVTEACNVLVVGEGNGRFLVECLCRCAHAKVTCLDASGQMLRIARSRIERLGLARGQVNFFQGDILTWRPAEGPFDLIVTQFFLDCFTSEQLELVVSKLSEAATPRVSWLLADFQVPGTGLRRVRAQIIHGLMYWFFRVITKLPARHLTPPDQFLTAQGFSLRERKVFELGLLHTDWWIREETQM
jgi:ubiquinone/menaquinone biosynthesis C-methylase UbiE